MRWSITCREIAQFLFGFLFAVGGCYRDLPFPEDPKDEDPLTGSPYEGFTIQVEARGTANTSIVSNPSGINCGSTCVASYPQYTDVGLLARYDVDSVISGWGGDCYGSSPYCLISKNENSFAFVETAPYRLGKGVWSANDWYWQNPLPQGNALYAVLGISPSDIWAVGNNGTTMHFDGTNWTPGRVMGPTALYALWAASPSDIWAVGESYATGVVYRFDGTTWNEVTIPKVNKILGIWGVSASDVWVVIQTGALHWDGMTWQKMPFAYNGNLTSIYGTGPSDVWALGERGNMWHWDGANWSERSTGTTSTLRQMWGLGPNDLWAVGGTILHWDGVRFTEYPQEALVLKSLYAVWGHSISDIWAMGTAGVTTHWDGKSWSAKPSVSNFTLRGIYTSSPDSGWAVGTEGALVRLEGTSWRNWTGGRQVLTTAGPLWGVDGSDIWNLTNNSMCLRWKGAGWSATIFPPEFYGSPPAQAVWGTSPQDIWFSSGHHYDGKLLTNFGGEGKIAAALPQYSTSMWGSSAKDIWAVGDSNKIAHYDGEKWTSTERVTTTKLYDVWSSSANNAWVVGDGGLVMHWDGTSWKSIPQDIWTFDLLAVSGAGGDIWVAASFGIILRYHEGAWTLEPNASGYDLHDIWMRSATDGLAVGDSGSITRWDGTAWTEEDSGTRNNLSHILVTPNDGTWVSGVNGTILYHR